MNTIRHSIVTAAIGCLALFATSCWTPAGQGRKAEAGYRAAAPVIAALEKFHNDHGNYPAALNELVPAYLPAEALLKHGGSKLLRSPRSAALIPDWEAGIRFGYTRMPDAYLLNFGYTGPGVNPCWYDSKTNSWGASGHY